MPAFLGSQAGGEMIRGKASAPIKYKNVIGSLPWLFYK